MNTKLGLLLALVVVVVIALIAYRYTHTFHCTYDPAYPGTTSNPNCTGLVKP